MEKSSSIDHDYNLWVLLAQARDAMIRARHHELQQYNISGRQSATLSAIHTLGEKATPTEISRLMFRTDHSVSELVGRMEKQGLVRKLRNLESKHSVRVELTDKGREAYLQSTNRESIHNIMSSLSKEQRRQLRSFLLILRQAALTELRNRQDLPFRDLL